ncbi:MAG: hypothetical protein WDM96_08585 [Lacunisphaera sp.]
MFSFSSNSRVSELISESPSRPDWRETQFLEGGGRQLFLRRQKGQHPGIDIARARAHHESAHGREAHGRVDHPAVAQRREAGAVAEVRKDQPGTECGPPVRCWSSARTLLKREAVETVAADALRGIAARQRQQPRRHGQVAMKRGVEACDSAARPPNAGQPRPSA